MTNPRGLGALGYLNLVDAGASDEFADAGCVGLLDLVAALKWVQTNIENFGGDPTRVFIFGQSGGGAKTSAIYSLPVAKGLFSRAAVQSGSALRGQARETSAKTTQALVKELRITRAERLVDVPWSPQSIRSGRTAGVAGRAAHRLIRSIMTRYHAARCRFVQPSFRPLRCFASTSMKVRTPIVTQLSFRRS